MSERERKTEAETDSTSANGRSRGNSHREGPPGSHRGGGPKGHRGGSRGARGRSRRGAGRGDVRIAALALLSEEPMHGYQLMGAIHERSGGVWQPSPGSVYPLLQQLADEGLVSSTEEGDRRIFSLTESGVAAAEEATDPDFWEARSAGSDGVDMRGAVGALTHAAKQVARTGTESQIVRAEKIVTEARKSLYLLLAED